LVKQKITIQNTIEDTDMVIKRVTKDTYPLQIQIVDSDNVPVDLTGSTVFLTVKRNIEDTDAEALLATSQTTHISPTEGITSFTLTAANTDYTGEFYYDVKIKSSASVITSVITDKFIVLKHVTIRTT